MLKNLQNILKIIAILFIISCSTQEKDVYFNIFPHSVYELTFPESDDVELTDRMKLFLDEAADKLKDKDEYVIHITGHSDNTGSPEDRYKRAITRVNNAVKYLKEKGISEERIKTFNKGDSVPVGDSNTEQGRKLNRRLEFKLTY